MLFLQCKNMCDTLYVYVYGHTRFINADTEEIEILLQLTEKALLKPPQYCPNYNI